MGETVRAPGASSEAIRRVQRGALGLSLTLVVQFLIGMFVNLFVEIPTAHPGAKPAEYFSGSVQSVLWGITGGPFLLIVHIAVGLLLFVGGAALVVSAVGLHRTGITTLAVLGVLGIAFAGFNGASFLDYGEDFSSMLMASGVAVAIASYVAILYMIGGAQARETQMEEM